MTNKPIKHATCPDCGQEMNPGTPCTWTHIKIGRKWYARSLEHWGAICHDCNAPAGSPHHPGCDVERCPKCNSQLISCDCAGDEWTLRKDI